MGLGVLVLSACQATARGGGTATPGGNGAVSEGPDPEGNHEGDNIGDLEARLDRLQQEQARVVSSSDGSFGVCEDLCSLASKICTVKEKLCEIADRHPGEDEYQGLCRKAELECNEAEDSCVACVEAREGGSSQPDDANESSAP
ncbi:MAG: hypothetical protein H6712_15810 [Myxococcales bacterium]|nr:hypothetical protein [Myxococcales bacterium]MCB9715333.1 hypothetical protein [Myxococcales bacterium]